MSVENPDFNNEPQLGEEHGKPREARDGFLFNPDDFKSPARKEQTSNKKEQSPRGENPGYDPTSVPIFIAVDKTIANYKGSKKQKEGRLSKEIIDRALDYGMSPMEFGDQFWAWKRKQKSDK